VKTKAENYSSELIERRWLSNKSFEITLTKPKYFYLCGRREMIREVTLLVDEKFAGSFLFTEPFY
jgi:hypothetical protein